MKISILFAAALAVSCSPVAPIRQPISPLARIVPLAGIVTEPIASPPPAPSRPEQPAIYPRVAVQEIRRIRFEGVSFDSRTHQLIVADQPQGPGTQFADSISAARAAGGIAAINAGFFTPEGQPLGLVVSSGEIAGAWNGASSLGSGVWYSDAAHEMRISRRETLGKARANAQIQLIQAGPLLMENFHPIGGLESTKSTVRSVLLWDGGTRWWLGCTSPCTLAATGSALATGSPATWRIRYALNLDGGRSSDLWISSSVEDGPLSRRMPWNRPVRNFLVLVKK